MTRSMTAQTNMAPYRVALAASTVLILIGLAYGRSQTDKLDPFHPRPSRVATESTDGSAALLPNRIQAGAIGSYELRVTLGDRGLPTGGRLLIGFPKAWFVNPFPIPKRLQVKDGAKPHALSVSASRTGTAFSVTVDTTGFTGKIERFNQTISATNAGAPLVRGDAVSIILANTTAPYISGADEVHVAVDPDGTGQFRPLRLGARYEIIAGPGEDFTLVGPTEAVVRRAIELQFTAFDRFGNVAEAFAGTVELTGTERSRKLRLTPTNRGSTIVTWTPSNAGFYFPEAKVFVNGRTPLMPVKGNPVRVFTIEPQRKTYWGELHSHSSISPDGIGTDPFPYARNAARLDFFAATEHADDDGNPRGVAIRPTEWQWIKDRVARFNEPGRFVTLLAYECSFPAPSGHHNVFFRSIDGVPWPAALMGSVQNLWSRVAAGEAITIPHHTGIAFMGPPPGAGSAGPEFQPIVTGTATPVTTPGFSVDWSIHNPMKRPLLEIYSLHGSSELYDPQDSLSYENARFTFSRSVPGAHYARDAWAAGLELGVVAASDNHAAQPGQPHGGLTAVRAARLTRDGIFDALASKNTYGTTGQRIYMDLEIAGVQMGHAGRAQSPVVGKLTIAAPSEIAHAEVLRRDFPNGEYVVAARWDNRDRLLETTFRDLPQSERVMYYLRVELRERVRDRVVRGWSSPVWLNLRAGD